MPAPPNNQLSVQHTDGATKWGLPYFVGSAHIPSPTSAECQRQLNQTINIVTIRTDIRGPLSAINIEGCVIGALPAASDVRPGGPQEYHQRCMHPQQTSSASSIRRKHRQWTCPIVVVRTYTFTDLCGNVSANLNQTINIDDNTSPTFTGPLSTINIEGCAIGALPAALDVAGWSPQELPSVTPAPPTTSSASQHTDGAPSGTCPIVVVRTYTRHRPLRECQRQPNQTINIDDNTAPTFTGPLSAVM